MSVPAHEKSKSGFTEANVPATITATAGPYSRCRTRAMAQMKSTSPRIGIASEPPDRPHSQTNGIDSTGYRMRVLTICQVGSLSAKYQGARCQDGEMVWLTWIESASEWPMSREIIGR